MGYQKIIIAGNIGREVELKYTPAGKAVCSFPVAVTEGMDKEHTEWFQVEAWEKTAEAAAKFLQKGSFVIVEGRLKTRKWTDKEGGDRYSTDLKASRVEFGPKTTGDSTPRPERPAQSQPAASSGGYDNNQFSPDEDIPFNCLPHWKEGDHNMPWR